VRLGGAGDALRVAMARGALGEGAGVAAGGYGSASVVSQR